MTKTKLASLILSSVAFAFRRVIFIKMSMMFGWSRSAKIAAMSITPTQSKTPPNKACNGRGYAPASQRVLRNKRIRKNGSVTKTPRH